MINTMFKVIYGMIATTIDDYSLGYSANVYNDLLWNLAGYTMWFVIIACVYFFIFIIRKISNQTDNGNDI